MYTAPVKRETEGHWLARNAVPLAAVLVALFAAILTPSLSWFQGSEETEAQKVQAVMDISKAAMNKIESESTISPSVFTELTTYQDVAIPALLQLMNSKDADAVRDALNSLQDIAFIHGKEAEVGTAMCGILNSAEERYTILAHQGGLGLLTDPRMKKWSKCLNDYDPRKKDLFKTMDKVSWSNVNDNDSRVSALVQLMTDFDKLKTEATN
jgi:hypothetical protein